MRKKIYLLGLLIFFVQDLVAQCAMCKAVAAEQAEEDGSSINTGIIYIMIIPYIILFFAFRKKIVSFVRELKGAGIAESNS